MTLAPLKRPLVNDEPLGRWCRLARRTRDHLSIHCKPVENGTWHFLVLPLLCLLLLASAMAGLAVGAVAVPLSELAGILLQMLRPEGLGEYSDTHIAVVQNIRLPRVLMGILVGASLAMCCAALQGLFRNPLADPALVGVSSGAALGAVSVIVPSGSVLRSLAQEVLTPENIFDVFDTRASVIELPHQSRKTLVVTG